jgi:hypothetical protein
MTVEALLQRPGGGRHSQSGWIACCPAHADKYPSLSVAERDVP